jgi:hypothetical protein
MAEERRPTRVYANCHCGHTHNQHSLEGCTVCDCTVYYPNYPRCSCAHLARQHFCIRPGVRGACVVCECEVYWPVGFEEADQVEVEHG